MNIIYSEKEGNKSGTTGSEYDEAARRGLLMYKRERSLNVNKNENI